MSARRQARGSVRLLSTLSTSALLAVPLAAVVVGDVTPGGDGRVTLAGGAVTTADRSRDGLAAAPSTPTVREFRLGELDRRLAARLAARPATGAGPSAPQRATVVVSEPRPVTGYGVVGAVWDGDRPGRLLFKVRTRLTGSRWSPWQTLHGGDCPCEVCTRARVAVAAGHGPNVDSPEFERARQGTDAMAVGEVDQVQLRVGSPRGLLPEGLALAVVDPQPTVTDGAARRTTRVAAPTEDPAARASATSTSLAPRPEIFTRSDWGANEKMRSGSPSYGTVKAGFVHHTVNSNGYTRGEVPAIIRGIYAYHTQSRGWSDIGYNFLVDRFGRIWEGRYGGMGRPVIGAHTLGYNHLAFAMSAIGNFDVAEPPPAVAKAYARLFAWKLDRHGVDAKSTARLDGRDFKAISGHRDAGSTACPGRYLYAELPGIRTAAAAIQAEARNGTTPGPRPGPGVARDVQGDGRPDLVVRDRESGRIQVLPGGPGPGFADRRLLDAPPGRFDLVAGVGDVTEDGVPDLLVRFAATGTVKVRPGREGGLFARALPDSQTTRFAGADLVVGVGDLTGWSRPDLVARDAATGRLRLHPGRSGGRFGAGTLLPVRPQDVRSVTGPGDVTGDGLPDLLVTSPDGRLLVFPGTAEGSVGAPVEVATGWAGRDLTVAGVDLTGDGSADLLERDARTGRTYVHALRSGGRPGPRSGGWTTWADLEQLTVIGDPGTGRARLLALTGTRELAVLDSNGTAHFGQPVDTGRRLADGDFAAVAGDWDRDGNLDVMARVLSTGNVGWHPGSGDGLLGTRVRLWTGWTGKSDLVVAGDLTGDRFPDLVARDPDGALHVYPSDGQGGRLPRQLARASLFATDLVTAAGYWNDDDVRDLVVRHAGNQQLYLLPGKPGGTLGTPVLLSDRFAGYDRVLGIGDHDGDGHPDLVATTPAGTLWLLPGKDDGLRSRRYLGEGLERFDLLG